MLVPFNLIIPEVGFNIPQIARIVVVLPAPFAPKNPKISRLPTLKEILSTTLNVPKVIFKFSTSIAVP